MEGTEQGDDEAETDTDCRLEVAHRIASEERNCRYIEGGSFLLVVGYI